MKALQVYGAVIVDQSGCNCLGFYSDVATQPDLTGLSSNVLAHIWIYYGN